MTNQQPTGNQQLPATGNVAIYARVATQEKRTEKQTLPPHDLMRLAHELGYEDTHIFVFEDNGKPGNSPIDERVGLATILHAITNGTMQAILVADETRLFRGIDATELTNFIHVCIEHHAIIYTPVATYDFTNPVHVKQFRFNCEQAYQMIARQVMQRTRSK